PPSTLVLIETAKLTPTEKKKALVLERALFVSAERPSVRDALRAIEREVARHEIEIDPRAADALLAARGEDLTALALEIEKLADYVGERRRIEKADVVALVPAAREPNVFELVDTMARSELDRALDLYDRLCAGGEDPLAVVGAAAWRFLGMWKKGPRGRRDIDRLHFVLAELLSADLDLKSTGGGALARRSRGREMVVRICAGGGARRSRRPARGRS
ncbi:MAG: hypothetical protein CME06_02030, partial [Gemmatimonadetes bacterium]|nr:hypothetical protein [Gemmatimonadota bacterium]